MDHPVVSPAHGARELSDGGRASVTDRAAGTGGGSPADTRAVDEVRGVVRVGPPYPTGRFLVFSDLHHLSSALWSDGPAFRRWLATNDGKVIARSAELLDAIVEQVLADHRREPLDFVVFTGDLTANGELDSHLDVAVAAEKIRAAGVPVYVIPGNHDIANPWAVALHGRRAQPTETVTPDDFRRVYADSGYGDAVTSPGDLSYRVDPLRGLTLLMIDSARYNGNAELGRPETAGAVAVETLEWMERELEAARRDGRAVIVFLHHALLDHSTTGRYASTRYRVDDAARVARVLLDGGAQVVITGHVHVHNNTVAFTDRREWIHELSTAPVSIYPHRYRRVSIDSGAEGDTATADGGGARRSAVQNLYADTPALTSFADASFLTWSFANYLDDFATRFEPVFDGWEERAETEAGEAPRVETEAAPPGSPDETARREMALYLAMLTLQHRSGRDVPGVSDDLRARIPQFERGAAYWERYYPARRADYYEDFGSDRLPGDGPITVDLYTGAVRHRKR